MSKSMESTPVCEAHDHVPHSHTPREARTVTQTAALFSALGDVERLRLMELLFDGPHCVSELAQETGQSMSLISQRLKILHQAKLLKRSVPANTSITAFTMSTLFICFKMPSSTLRNPTP